ARTCYEQTKFKGVKPENMLTGVGDTLTCSMLEYSKVDARRRNHVWAPVNKFGMSIEYLFEKYLDLEVNDQDIGEIEFVLYYYKASKQLMGRKSTGRHGHKTEIIAHVANIEGKERPLIVFKKHGGRNYASMDLAALRSQFEVE
ncbi:hypothetical protein M8C21_017598, partial [Ambrosia artemisiifolia]